MEYPKFGTIIIDGTSYDHDVVVDAGVATMWFVPERHSDRAAPLLAPEYQLVAPDLIRIEVGSAVLKAIRRDEMTLEDGEEALGTLMTRDRGAEA